eukprot:gene22776-biopygen20772
MDEKGMHSGLADVAWHQDAPRGVLVGRSGRIMVPNCRSTLVSETRAGRMGGGCKPPQQRNSGCPRMERKIDISAALNSPSRDDSAGPHGSSSGCWSSPGTISLNRTRRTAPHRAGEAAVLRREEVEDVAPHAVEAAVLRREEVEDVAPHAVEAAVLRREEVAATPHCAGEATDGSLCTLRRLLPQSQRRPAQVTHSPEQQALLFETVAALSDLTSTFSTASGAGVRHSALRRSAHRKRRRGK